MDIFKIICLLFFAILQTGCIEFGDAIETTSPSKLQLESCRSVMFLNPEINITPLGFKLMTSGIDNAIWFKFKTHNISILNIFD